MVTRFPQTFSITKVRSKSDVEFIFNNPHCTKNDASRLKRIFELISYPFVIFQNQIISTKYTEIHIIHSFQTSI